MDKKQSTKEGPVPKRGEFMRNLKKMAKKPLASKRHTKK